MTDISPTGINDFWTSPRPSTKGGETWDSRPPSRMETCGNARYPNKYSPGWCGCFAHEKPASEAYCETCILWEKRLND